jgi:photosystem II stability/assembly factor-like uncharacterized protein
MRGMVILGMLLLLFSSPTERAAAGENSWSSNGPDIPMVYVVTVDAAFPDTLFAGTSDGLFKSTDACGSWTESSTGLITPEVFIVTIDLSNPDTVYAGTLAGVFKSTDGGENWSESSTGLGSPSVASLAIDGGNGNTLYAGTNGGGIYKSTDGGENWSEANTGLFNPLVHTLAIDPANANTVYAGTEGGVYKTTDGGQNWGAANNGLTAQSIFSLAVDPVTPSTVYAGAMGGGIFKSTDGGGSWSSSSNGVTSDAVTSVVVVPVSPDILYVGTWGEGVFKSEDGGENWSSFNDGLTSNFVMTLAVTPNSIYAGTMEGGVFTYTFATGNDPPVNTVPGTQTVNEDASLTLTPSITVSDPDFPGPEPEQVLLKVGQGTLTLGSTNGLDFTCTDCQGDGTADAEMTFQGKLADINTALAGMTFQPNSDYNGEATLTIMTNDLGNTGGGQQSDTDTLQITVTPINDPPIAINITLASIPENQPANTIVGALSTEDVDTGDTFVYSLGCDNPGPHDASFNIDGDKLRTSALFDYETKNSYDICIRTRDQGGTGLTFDKNFTISVTDSTPTGVTASKGTYTDKVQVNWNASPGATSYQVFRATNSSGANGKRLGIFTPNNLDDTTATPGVSYYYWVKACTGTVCSNFSFFNTGWRNLTAPTNVQASDGTFPDKVQVTWTASLGATSYQVFRGTSAAGANGRLLGSTTTTTFKDRTAKPGTTYYYWVKAIRYPNSSNYSAYDTGQR